MIETTRSDRADEIVNISRWRSNTVKVGHHRVTNSFGSSVENPKSNILCVENDRKGKDNAAYIDGLGSESIGSTNSYPQGCGESQGSIKRRQAPKVMSTNVSVAHNDLLLS